MNIVHSRLVKRHSGVRALIVFILAVCGSGFSASAQDVTATINGIVTDPSGQVVANADVKAQDLDRGTTWPAIPTDPVFTPFRAAPVGRYEVRVVSPGFRTAVQSPD